MSAFDVRDIIKASGETKTDGGGIAAMGGSNRPLHPLAERIAAMPFRKSLSPVMVEGLVRLFEMAIVAIIGLAIFAVYVFPVVRYSQPYAIAIPVISVSTVAIFQALHLYHVGAMRSFAPQSSSLSPREEWS